MSEYRKYNFMENVLNEINGKFVSLQKEEKRRNNEILLEVCELLKILVIYFNYLDVFAFSYMGVFYIINWLGLHIMNS